MRFTERDRRELIQKLRQIKDPRERDRILWALDNQEEAFFHSSPLPVPMPRSVPRRLQPERPAPSKKTPDMQNRPRTDIHAKRMLGFVVPAFFAIFGLVRIGQAVLNYFASRNIEVEIPGLIAGGIFLIIGLAGIFRAMRPPRIKQNEAS